MVPSLPYGLTTTQAPSGDLVVSQPTTRSFAGRITFPYVDHEDSLSFIDLEIPSAGRFTQDDLGEMWIAARRMAEWRTRVARQDPEDFARPTVIGQVDVVQDWHAVEACAHQARSLLGNWPSLLDRRLTWLPVGVPGGVEDLATTERVLDGQGALRRTSPVRIDQSARWTGTRRRWQSASVAMAAELVVTTSLASTPMADHERLQSILASISRVGRVAAPTGRWGDPDPSSWPRVFGDFVSACFQAIADLEARERGTGAIPLLDTDEIYEAWLALRVWGWLEDLYGPAQAAERAQAKWETDHGIVELWIKPVFKSSEPFAVGAETYCAIGAQRLVPDLMLSRVAEGETSLVVLDAKAWSSIESEEVLSETAKYLYGIRYFLEDNRNEVPVVSHAQLFTCAMSPTISSGDAARLGVTTSTPTLGVEATNDALLSMLSKM